MRRRSGVVHAMAIGVALALSACAGTLEGDPSSYQVQLEPGCNVVPVFAQHCATPSCHGGSTPQAGLDLGSPGVRKRLLGVASKSQGCETRLLVDPADVNRSFLLEKLESGAPSCGDPMPLTGEITDADRACIRAWAVAITGGPKDAGAAEGGAFADAPGPASVDSGSAGNADAGGTP